MLCMNLVWLLWCPLFISCNTVQVLYESSCISGEKPRLRGRCVVTLPSFQSKGNWRMRIILNKETTDFKICEMEVQSSEQNGRIYHMHNIYHRNGTVTVRFQLNYFGSRTEYPKGTCESFFDGESPSRTYMSTTSFSTSSKNTVTINNTNSIESTTMIASTNSSFTSGQPLTTTLLSTATALTFPITYSRAKTAASTETTTATSTTMKTTTTTVKSTTTPIKVNTKYNYTELLHKSILFYEAQRSGNLPSTNRIPYRGDSSLNDQGEFGEDLSGGWHDAGDHVKFNFPMASSTTLLALSLYLYKEAYKAADELSNMYECIRWPLEYFVKCWREPDRYYATVGNPFTDHAYWGRPEDMTMGRPAYYVDASNPGSDVAAETASAMAASALAFASYDKKFSNTLLQNAEGLYNFAKSNRGIYSTSIPAVSEYYSSRNDTDELCLSAVLLYMITGTRQYLDDAINYHPDYTAWSLSWDEKTVLCQVLLMNISKSSNYKEFVHDFLNNYINGEDPEKTPCGLSYRLRWAPLRYAANAAFVALLAADTGVFTKSESDDFRTYAMSQIHYALGDNQYDRSYVVGFGNNPPLRPHHRAASCPPSGSCGLSYLFSPYPNPHILYGALVGGPDENDEYDDDRLNYVKNEVACDYNAGFQSAVAVLQSLAIRGELPPAPPKPKSCQ